MRNSQIGKTFRVSVFLIFLILSSNLASAQFDETVERKSVYFGVGVGINDCGLAFSVEKTINDRFSGFASVGIGGWGYKIGFGAIFYSNQVPYGSSFSLGYSLATGLDNFETELSTEPYDEKENVMLDLNNVGTINLIYAYNWRLGRKGKFSLYTGYAFAVTNNSYDVKSSGTELSDESKQVLNILQPGGLILGLKFMF